MSDFTNRSTTLIIGDNDLFSGDPVLISEEPVVTNEGWDSMVRNYVVLRAEITDTDLAAMFPIGGRLGTRTWWITGAKPVVLAEGVFRLEVSHKGWASEKPAVVKIGSNADQRSASNIYAPTGLEPATAVFGKVETHENTPTITVGYLVEDIEAEGASKTAFVGTAVTPPVTVETLTSLWDWTVMPDFTWHWPQGWVLMGSDQDRLPGTNAAWVSDSYKFIQAATP